MAVVCSDWVVCTARAYWELASAEAATDGGVTLLLMMSIIIYERVRNSGLRTKKAESNQLFQWPTAENNAMVAIIGVDIGKISRT